MTKFILKLYYMLRGYSKEDAERKVIVQQLRSHLAFFGCDTSHLTDEEIEAGTIKFAKSMRNFGIRTDEAIVLFDALRGFITNKES